MKKQAPLNCIGWREWVSLPELKVKRIKVKVDTGAKTSVLHAFDIHFLDVQHGHPKRVKFTIHPEQHTAKKGVTVTAPVIDERVVKSSSGHRTIRPVIQTTLVIGPYRYPIELNLVNRDIMGFRMLLGRQALRKRWVVHPGKSYFLSNLSKKKNKPEGK